MTQADAPLTGLRVLELATGVAGPYAGRLLAMLGATVVKVEPPGGDPARTKQVDDRPLTGISPLYLHLNAGKLNASANWVVRRLGVEPQEELASARSPEELGLLAAISARAGALPSDTAMLLQRTIRFGDKRAAEAAASAPT